jgi:hypothetical protein
MRPRPVRLSGFKQISILKTQKKEPDKSLSGSFSSQMKIGYDSLLTNSQMKSHFPGNA